MMRNVFLPSVSFTAPIVERSVASRAWSLCVIAAAIVCCVTAETPARSDEPAAASPQDTAPRDTATSAPAGDLRPLSDPENAGGWVLNEAMSDEFEAPSLDTTKWWVEGTDGVYKKWAGRQPAQYSPSNVRVEDGRLKIGARWTPEFDFIDKLDSDGRRYENLTTGCVINFNKVKYGYLETKVKPGLASVTGAFWLTGNGCELDVFELMGAPKQPNKQHLRRRWRSNIVDWSNGRRPVFREHFEVPWEVGEQFHVYGCEWTPESMTWWGDGVKIHEITKEEMGEDWVLDVEMLLWLDSEVFHWNGYPEEQDLPVDFEVEYVRVWQKPEHLSESATAN